MIYNNIKFYFRSVGESRKGPNKLSCEDSFAKNSTRIAICDGVGGSRTETIDPALLAFDLARKSVIKQHFLTKKHNILWFIDHIMDQYIEAGGSTTICLAHIDNYRQAIHIGNVGDSGFMQFRYLPDIGSWQMIEKSTPGTFAYNTPFQLGLESAYSAMENGQQYLLPIIENDLILFGTDGLFDNVTNSELCYYVNIISKQYNKTIYDQEMLFDLNTSILDFAFLKMNGDYTNAEQTQFGLDRFFETGLSDKKYKFDDVTVVVARICVKHELNDINDYFISPNKYEF